MGFTRKATLHMAFAFLCTVLFTSTLAWTSLNSQRVNSWSGEGGGSASTATLHDDHEENSPSKEIYVENWGDADVFVRVRLYEYMKMGNGAGLKPTAGPFGETVRNPQNFATPVIGGTDIGHLNTWALHTPTSSMPDGCSPDECSNASVIHSFWKWATGGQKYYYPAPVGKREDPTYVDQGSTKTLGPDSMNDAHVRAQPTLTATVLGMAQWKAEKSPIGSYWVYDVDGWAYWAAPLHGGEATGLLLGQIEMKTPPADDYYFAVLVDAQMASKDGEEINGVKDNYEKFGLLENGGWTGDGQELMNSIVKASVDKTPGYESQFVTETPIAMGTPIVVVSRPVAVETPTAINTPSIVASPVATQTPTATQTPEPTIEPAKTPAPPIIKTPVTQYTRGELEKILYIIDTLAELKERRDTFGGNGLWVENPNLFDEMPSMKPPYSAGLLKASYNQLAIDNFNLVRHIAGLPDNIVYDEPRAATQQTGALVLAILGELSHSPRQPEGVPNALYQLGYDAAHSSNLSMNAALMDTLWLYMKETENDMALGHRRWMLNPGMGKTAFGQVGAITTMHALDTSSESSGMTATWPCGVFPIDQLDSYVKWSVSAPNLGGVNIGDVSVKMTRKRGNRVWDIKSSENYSNGMECFVSKEWYGSGPAVIFRPDYLSSEYAHDPLYKSGDVFHVSMEGLGGTIEYTVKLFDVKERKNIVSLLCRISGRPET